MTTNTNLAVIDDTQHQNEIPEWILYNSMVVDEDGKPRNLKMDKKAVRSYFLNSVNQNTVFFHSLKEKIDYLIENDYYEEAFLKKYTFEEVKAVFQVAYDIKFRFESYMSAFKVYNDYVLQTNDKKRILERYEDRMAVIALYHSNGNVEKAKEMVKSLVTQEFTPATPTLLNTGRKRRGEFVSCFLLKCGDSLNDISRTLEQAMQLSKRGGGVSIDITNVRARGETIKKVANAAKGALGVAKLLDQSFRYADQMGQRQGAGAVYLNIFHSDVEELLGSKAVSADADSRLVTLSIGLVIPDKFVELARKNEDVYLFYPYTVTKEYGIPFSTIAVNMDKWYDKLVANPRVRKRKVSARNLLQSIAITQSESGYPYIMFSDNVNKVNPLDDDVEFSNLCTEILQPSELSSYADYDQRDMDKIGRDISCNLSSLNVRNTMKRNSLERPVFLAMDVMNSVSENTDLTMIPGVARANRLMRSVGLGAMDFHGYLAEQYVSYGSPDSIEFADVYFNMVNFYTLKHSMLKAKETGSKFYKFVKSSYADGSYFDKHGEIVPTSDKVISMFAGMHIPTQAEWNWLKEMVMEHGLYNSHRMAVAPTGSISYTMNATPSVTPIKKLVEERTYGNSKTYYPMPKSDVVGFMYESSYDMDIYKIIDVIATIQKHVDQGISFELNVKSTVDSRELQRIYLYAHHKGVKTLYYTRTKKVQLNADGKQTEQETNLAECESCAV